LGVDGPYKAVIDLVSWLLAYGLYSCAVLAAIRKLRPHPVGQFGMDSSEFAYWKLTAVLTDLGEKALRPFDTVFTRPLIQALLGVNMGKQVAIGGLLRDWPLLYLEDNCAIGQNSVITAHIISSGKITLKPVRIGCGAVVGINCVVMPGVTLGKGAVLAPGAVAVVDTQIPDNELWGGVPARKIKELASPD
jgi:acetyltransferase-like isoleucine patch superfamily enzyme